MSKRSANVKRPAKSEPKADRPFAPGYGIVDVKQGAGLLPWAWVAKKMSPCRTFWLATIRAGLHPSQTCPHVMPVWGVWLDDAFFFSTGRKSRKGRNLTANPACTIANDDGEEAVIVQGVAEEVREEAILVRVAATYKKKYKMDPRSMGEPIFIVRPKTVFGFIERSFAKSATRWSL
ncbi:MAG: pyridoxamine 5'-phosphate oxidase family protein [Terriglobales bacterium]|jgi:nitroimidazol reductase NimA-like FMN-containing flavoprotein (pyridoxamine 5'-phosphate oxidase superfamily)